MKTFAGGLWAAMGIILLTAGCAPELDIACQVTEECQADKVCKARRCVLAAQTDGEVPTEDGTNPGTDARPDSTTSPDGETDGDRIADAQLLDAARDGTIPTDGPPPTPDLGAGGEDGAVPPPTDAAISPPDGPLPTDAAIPPLDGPLPTDAAIPPPDGPLPTDAAIPPPDGPLPTDAAIPPLDAANCDPGCIAQCTRSPELCDGLDNDCDDVIDNVPGLSQACTVGLGVCSREGLTTCGGCEGVPGIPGDEVCDGADNDCDGIIDNGLECDCNPGENQACYTGSAGTQNVGICQGGTQFCSVDHHWAACLNQNLPSTELCDNLDNDCDGVIDNLVGLGEACTVGLGECRSEGIMECGGMNGQLRCSATALTPSTELCDNLDNDCDGVIDNLVGLGEACAVGLGECRSEGIMECSGMNGQLRCSATALEPTPELCDNLDNDCDGQTDEDNNGSPRMRVSCYSGPAPTEGIGACRSGTQECIEGLLSECMGEINPSNEDCIDRADNNCDGTIDNGLGCLCTPITIRPCYDGPALTEGIGTCRAGSSRCNQSGTGYEACAEQILPVAEECNGLDDNCNGLDDDELFDQACYTGPPATRGVGACRDGMSICLGQDGWSICSTEILPTPEICDGLDNDCDGIVDNNPAESGMNCSSGRGQCAVAGHTVCQDGNTVCDAVPRAPVVERCNAIDDDCDGVVDNGLNCPTWTAPVGPEGEQFVGTVTEVTKAQYGSCVSAGACVAPDPTPQGIECNWQLPDRLDHPINCLTWSQARTYCEWIGGDLPTEEQWETLAGGRDLVQPWGNLPGNCNRAHTGGCLPRGTVPVLTMGLEGVSPSGAHETIGGLREWTRTLVNGDPVLKGGGFDDSLQGMNINILWNLVLPSGILNNRASYDLGSRCFADIQAPPNP